MSSQPTGPALRWRGVHCLPTSFLHAREFTVFFHCDLRITVWWSSCNPLSGGEMCGVGRTSHQLHVCDREPPCGLMWWW